MLNIFLYCCRNTRSVRGWKQDLQDYTGLHNKGTYELQIKMERLMSHKNLLFIDHMILHR
jgi:hypothetical protein